MPDLSFSNQGLAIAIATLVMQIAGCNATLPRTVSDHFDGTRFFNRENETGAYTFIERMKWLWSTKLVEWPEWIDDKKQPPPKKDVALRELRVTHINHATMLIQVDTVNILTDPIWSERASVVSWFGPKRVRAPGVDINDLPCIDVVLISHDHYDHLDIETLKKLTRMFHPKIIVGLGVKALLTSEGIEGVEELDWWQRYDVLPNGIQVVFVPARHGSGRGLFDTNKTLWGGFVVESSVGNIYFAGDTGYGDFLSEIKQRYPSFRLALLPVGHYEPRWMMEPVHMNPDDSVKLHRYLNVQQSVGMHFGTFHGTGAHNNETVDQHEADLRIALKKYDLPETAFWILGFGEGRDVTRVEPVSGQF